MNKDVLRRIVRDSIRIYFAPLTGAFKGMRHEWRRLDRDIERRRRKEMPPKSDATHQA